MPVYRLPRAPVFPDPRLADPEGLLAVGGDLSTSRLLAAYRSGVFPWFSDGDPLLWWSPDPRMVLAPAALHLPRSLRKRLRSGRYRVRADTDFAGVIRSCSRAPRPGQRGTWITERMVRGYTRLHTRGFAHSFEAFEGDVLVGGLYGVAVGALFAGESMFARAPDASKVAFAVAARWLAAAGCTLIDCQLHTEHLARFGATEISREEYLHTLGESLRAPPLPTGSWTAPFDAWADARRAPEGSFAL